LVKKFILQKHRDMRSLNNKIVQRSVRN